MKEIFKTIPDYPDYMVSNFGRVKSLKYGKERILKNQTLTDRRGLKYRRINLSQNGVYQSFLIHRLILSVFRSMSYIGNTYVTDHIDNNTLNNNLNNLRIITNRENVTKGYLLKNKKTKSTGVRFSRNKKNPWQAQIKLKSKKNKNLGYYKTEKEASEAYQKALREL